MIVIIDYNCGNVGSISNMLKKIGAECEVSSNHDKILNADKLILPGVGSFDNGMNNLKSKNLIDSLNEFALIRKKPVLGICLGMQLMSISSEEGVEKGLSWIEEPVVGFKNQIDFTGTIPVMGWNYVDVARENFLQNEDNKRYYFVHSYFYNRNRYSILNARINEFEYCAAFQKENIFGVQFHPEKSHKFGMELLQKFCSI
jgi:glutamine amidotransferase